MNGKGVNLLDCNKCRLFNQLFSTYTILVLISPAGQVRRDPGRRLLQVQLALPGGGQEPGRRRRRQRREEVAIQRLARGEQEGEELWRR